MTTELPGASPVDLVRPRTGTRTWGDDERCAECCNGDRCDDPTHYDRGSKPGCPHCWNTGWALWTEAGQRDYAKYRRWDAYKEEIVAAERAEFVRPSRICLRNQHE